MQAAMFKFHEWADDEARATVYAFEGDPVIAAAVASVTTTPPSARSAVPPPPQCNAAADRAAIAVARDWLPKAAAGAESLADLMRGRAARMEKEFEAKRREMIAVLDEDRAVELSNVARESKAHDDSIGAKCAELRRDYALKAAEATKVLAQPVTP